MCDAPRLTSTGSDFSVSESRKGCRQFILSGGEVIEFEMARSVSLNLTALIPGNIAQRDFRSRNYSARRVKNSSCNTASLSELRPT